MLASYLSRSSLCLVVCATLTACAGSAGGLSTSSLSSHSVKQYKSTQTSQFSPILVKLRFPSLVREDAKFQFVQAYTMRRLGPESLSDALGYTQEVDSSIAKTAYFANEFYGALVKRLPEKSIIVEPYQVGLARNGTLTTRSLDKTPMPPSVLTVEFATYHTPNPDKMMDADVMTFGDLVTPLMVIKAHPSASPKTGGLLVASAPIVAPSGHSEKTMRVEPSKLSFVSYMNYGPARLTGMPVHDSRPAKRGSILRLPTEKLQMNGARLIEHAGTPGGLKKSPFDVAVRGYVDVVIEALNSLDVDRAVRPKLQHWAKHYDRRHGGAAFSEAPGGTAGKRLAFLKKIYEVEKNIATKRADATYLAIRRGEFSQSMRHLLGAETTMLNKRRGHADTQNVSMVATIGLSVLGGVASYEGNYQAASLAQTGAGLALDTMQEAIQLSQDTVTSFRSNYRRFYQVQSSQSFTLAESGKADTARSLADFRVKAKKAYRKRFK